MNGDNAERKKAIEEVYRQIHETGLGEDFVARRYELTQGTGWIWRDNPFTRWLIYDGWLFSTGDPEDREREKACVWTKKAHERFGAKRNG